MTECSAPNYNFQPVKGRKIEASFNGGDVSSDGGSLLLQQTDRSLELTKKIANILQDNRQKAKIQHSNRQIVRQRLYALALGYEDLNDHDELRKDPLFQTAVEQDHILASASTICRFENAADRHRVLEMSELLVNLFIDSFDKQPEELVLDFDATDDIVHGMQAGRFYHGYYNHYCFLPLYVFCGSHLLAAYLRPSNQDPAKHSWAILSLLVRRFREKWPAVRIIFRADGGFCRHRMLEWCNSHDVGFIVGIGRNSRLTDKSSLIITEAEELYDENRQKVRLFTDINYAAATWKEQQRVIVKAEHNSKGANTRFVVTNLPGAARKLYDNVYCARGDMENRIKEQQLYLFADRTSCSDWWANQFRLLLSSFAYVLFDTMRRTALAGTKLAKATCETIRLKLLKIGAVVTRNTRTVRVMLSSSYPFQNLFRLVSHRLASG